MGTKNFHQHIPSVHLHVYIALGQEQTTHFTNFPNANVTEHGQDAVVCLCIIFEPPHKKTNNIGDNKDTDQLCSY